MTAVWSWLADYWGWIVGYAFVTPLMLVVLGGIGEWRR